MKPVIREADFDKDALAIVDGARDFADRVTFTHLFPTGDKEFTAAVGRIVTLPGVEILVADYEGKVVGGIGMLYAQYMWNPSKSVADELFWWAARDAPFRAAWYLIHEVMRRVRERKAIPMFRALMTSPPGVEQIYRKFGMGPLEIVFTDMP